MKRWTRISSLVLASVVCASAHAEPTIELKAPLAYLFGIGGNINHGYMTERCGYRTAQQGTQGCGQSEPYGAWMDGPMNPYKFAGNTYFQIPMSEIHRIRIPGHFWGRPTTWRMEPTTGSPAGSCAPVHPLPREQLESVYGNRNWMFSVYAENGNLHGLTHHEWYRQPRTIGRVTGFDAINANGYLPWVATIGWAKSVDGGQSWRMRDTSDFSSRVILVPEPSGNGYAGAPYGFMHPSNIVKQDGYYYAFVSTANYRAAGGGVQKQIGVSLLRSASLETTMDWQFWTGTHWENIDHGVFQGNMGRQQPYVFWKREDGCSHLYAMNVRKHRDSGKWIVLGSKYCLPRESDGSFRFQAVYSWTADLSNPVDLEKFDAAGNLVVKEVQQNGISLRSNNYYSFFDTSGGDYVGDNYEVVGNDPLLVVTDQYQHLYHQYLHLSGF